MVVTAFLGVGGGELLLVALVFLLLFGVDRLPEIARTFGRLRGEWERASREVRRELRTEEEIEKDRRFAFERERDRQVREALPEVQELRRLRDAAEALGLDVAGKDADALRAAIAEATRHPGEGRAREEPR